jgi:hypothetical protein
VITIATSIFSTKKKKKKEKDEKGFAALPMFSREKRFAFPPKVNNVLCECSLELH